MPAHARDDFRAEERADLRRTDRARQHGTTGDGNHRGSPGPANRRRSRERTFVSDRLERASNLSWLIAANVRENDAGRTGRSRTGRRVRYAGPALRADVAAGPLC